MNNEPLVERVVADFPAGTSDCLQLIADRYNLKKADVVREAIHDLLNKLQVPPPRGLVGVVPILDEYVKIHGYPMVQVPFHKFLEAYAQ